MQTNQKLGLKMKFYAPIIGFLLLLPVVLVAETINVPDDHETIQEAINAAENGDVVLVAPGTYNESLDFIGKAITVASRYLTTRDASLIPRTIINPDGQGRAVRFQNNENNNSRLIGFTLTGGSASYGGAVYCLAASPVLDHLLIYGNTAERYGGGIYATRGARPALSFSTVVNNSAGTDRGAMHLFDGATVTVSNSIIWGNDPVGLVEGFTITFTDVQEGYAGQGNLNVDPRFVDVQESDFRLTGDSPCIDRGDPNAQQDPDGTRADMGALFFRQVPAIRLEPNGLDFGALNVGFSRQLELAVVNVGAAVLHIESVTLEQDGDAFEILGGDEEGDVPGGELRRVSVRFEPTGVQAFSGEVVIVSDDPDDGEVRAALSGEGLPPVPDAGWSPQALEFGQVPLQGRIAADVTLYNSGHAALNVSRMELAGDDAGQFSIDFDGEFQVAANDSIVKSVEFHPTRLNAFIVDLTIECDDPQDSLITIRVTGEGVMPARHFEPIFNTGVNHSLLVLEVTVEGEALAAGGEVAVFSPDGLCCGSAFWLGEQVGFAAWGDNELTEEVDGLVEGDEMTFRVWDAASQRELDAEAEFVRGGIEYEDDGLSVFNLDGVAGGDPGYQLRLIESWNMVSVPVALEENNIVPMWQPLVDENQLVMVKDHVGRFYRPDFRFNNIPFWDYHFGYQVKMNGVDSLWVAGELLPEDEEIPLREGWSIVAYYPEREILAPEALQNIQNVLVIAKDNAGRFYMPAFRFNNIPPMRRGQGYLVRVSQAVGLVWNFGQQVAGGQFTPSPPTVHYEQPTTLTGSDMSLLVTAGNRLIPPGEVGVFAPSGRCVAACAVGGSGPWGAAVRGDDVTTELTEGARDGEPLQFRFWNGSYETILNHSDTYTKDGLLILELPTEVYQTDGFRLIDLHPNPFNSITQVRFQTGRAGLMRISVIDAQGRELLVPLAGHLAAGQHQTAINLDNFPSGAYFLRLAGPEGMLQKKIILAK